eukprot:1606630-Ditylum_brightwellii.AAC.1
MNSLSQLVILLLMLKVRASPSLSSTINLCFQVWKAKSESSVQLRGCHGAYPSPSIQIRSLGWDLH